MGPVTRELAARKAELRITAVTLPCPYASGGEGGYALRLPGVREALPLSGALRRGRAEGESAVVLQLGGDPMYGCALSKRLAAPWLIYTARPKWRGRVTRYFLPDGAALARFDRAGVTEERRVVVGNLILDSVPEVSSAAVEELRERYSLSDKKIIVFMAGSRPFEYETGFPFFASAAARLNESHPEWSAVMPVAPTVDDENIASGLAANGLKWRGGAHPQAILVGGAEIPLIRGRQYEAIAASSLAVALPGTNNLQIAALGVPLLMVAPLNRAAEIPLDGLPGAIPQRMPGFSSLKRSLVHWFNAREQFVSLPNRLAGREVVPEHRELMTPESALNYILELVESPELRRAIVRGYAALDLKKGAAAKIADEVCRWL